MNKDHTHYIKGNPLQSSTNYKTGCGIKKSAFKYGRFYELKELVDCPDCLKKLATIDRLHKAKAEKKVFEAWWKANDLGNAPFSHVSSSHLKSRGVK